MRKITSSERTVGVSRKITMRLILIVVLLASLLCLSLLYFFRQNIFRVFFLRNDQVTEVGITKEDVDLFASEHNKSEGIQKPIEEIEQGLQIPWEVEFLEDESILVTERAGNLLRISPDYRSVIKIDGVVHVGEGGLMGMALHPDFAHNHWIYLYMTSRNGSGLINRLERYEYDLVTNTLSMRMVILADIPGDNFHDGGRIAFGFDGYLYITTGDAGIKESAQDTNLLSGKILRIEADGGVPDDNPFGNAVWSYGHRNPQGLAWDERGRLWATEHGPSGTETGYDEVNLIVKGGNYGWPEIRGDEVREGMITPVIQSGGSTTWAPASLAIVGDELFFAGLRGESLYSAKIIGDQLVDLEANFNHEYGRLRTVKRSPDGEWLYITTSNRDGRGAPAESDDRLIKVALELFK